MTDLIHYCEGHFCKTDELSVHPHDLGFMRAYGVFDFAPVYNGVPFKLREHLERLSYCAKELDISMPKSIEAIKELSLQLLEMMPSFTGGIRIFVTGGSYDFDTLISAGPPSLMILSEEAPPPHLEGIKAVTTTVMRPLPQVKTIGYLPAVLGMHKAKSQGCHDALYMSASGQLLEGMTSNLFFIKEGALYTDDSNQIIKGVTRGVVLEAAEDLLPINLRAIHLSEVADCEEAFLTSSTKDLVPVLEIDGNTIGTGKPGALTARLREKFLKLRMSELSRAQMVAS